MPKLKILSGDEVLKILSEFGFRVVGQKGSHIKIARLTSNNQKQTLIIPNHTVLDRGTLRGIIRQTSRYIPEEILRGLFY